MLETHGLLIALALSLISSVILWSVSAHYVPSWNTQGRFDKTPGGKNKWTIVFALATILGLASTFAMYQLQPNIFIAAAISICLWIMTLTSYTDFTVLRIPSEPSIVAYYLGLPLLLGYGLQSGAWGPIFVALGIWLIMPILFFFPRSIGMGDVRLMLIAATSLSWWVGIQGMYVTGLFIGVGLQLLFFAVAHSAKKFLNYDKFGVWAYRGELSGQPNKAKGAGPLNARNFVEKKGAEKKKQLHLPFGPALMFGFIAAAFWVASKTDPGTCSAILGNFC